MSKASDAKSSETVRKHLISIITGDDKLSMKINKITEYLKENASIARAILNSKDDNPVLAALNVKHCADIVGLLIDLGAKPYDITDDTGLNVFQIARDKGLKISKLDKEESKLLPHQIQGMKDQEKVLAESKKQKEEEDLQDQIEKKQTKLAEIQSKNQWTADQITSQAKEWEKIKKANEAKKAFNELFSGLDSISINDQYELIPADQEPGAPVDKKVANPIKGSGNPFDDEPLNPTVNPAKSSSQSSSSSTTTTPLKPKSIAQVPQGDPLDLGVYDPLSPNYGKHYSKQ